MMEKKQRGPQDGALSNPFDDNADVEYIRSIHYYLQDAAARLGDYLLVAKADFERASFDSVIGKAIDESYADLDSKRFEKFFSPPFGGVILEFFFILREVHRNLRFGNKPNIVDCIRGLLKSVEQVTETRAKDINEECNAKIAAMESQLAEAVKELEEYKSLLGVGELDLGDRFEE